MTPNYFAWHYLKDDYEKSYMDSCNLWEHKYFQHDFDESTPPYEEDVIE